MGQELSWARPETDHHRRDQGGGGMAGSVVTNYSNYLKSNIQIELFGIPSFLKNWIYSVFSQFWLFVTTLWQAPAVLSDQAITMLEQAGWSLCHMEMPDYMKKQTIPQVVSISWHILLIITLDQYTLSHSKLFVWNMTQYDTVLWLDSDTVVANSLHTIFAKADGWVILLCVSIVENLFKG